jgi:toxin YoeB
MYQLLYSPQAKKDTKKLARSGLRANAEVMLDLIEEDPYAYPPGYEFLSGKLKGFISRRTDAAKLIKELIDEKVFKRTVRVNILKETVMEKK